MKILAVYGSAKGESTTVKMVTVIVDAAQEAGAAVEKLNLSQTPLPLFRVDGRYDQDYPIIDRVRSMCQESDAFVLLSPEYHGSMSGWMKNFFDFHYEEFAGKLFGIVVSTGGSHGTSCSTHIRASVQYCHGWTLPYQAAARESDFDANGEIKNASVTTRLARVGRDVAIYGQLLKDQFDRDREESRRETSTGKNLGFVQWHI